MINMKALENALNTGVWDDYEAKSARKVTVNIPDSIADLKFDADILEQEKVQLQKDIDKKKRFISRLEEGMKNIPDSGERNEAECLYRAAQNALQELQNSLNEKEEQENACLAQLNAVQAG